MRIWALIWVLLCGPAAAQNLVIATTGTFPPYLFEEGETARGFDIDLMDAICALNGFTCTYRILPLTEGLEAVQNGAADVALGGIGATDEREVYGDFTCPYRVGTPASVPIFALDPDIDLRTARIAVMGDTLSHRDLVDHGFTAVPYEDLASAIRSTLSGDTDAYHGNDNSLPLVDGAMERFVVVGTITGRSGGAAFLVSSMRPRLLAAINDSFGILERDGRLQQMGDRWFGPGRYAPPPNMGVTCGTMMSRL